MLYAALKQYVRGSASQSRGKHDGSIQRRSGIALSGIATQVRHTARRLDDVVPRFTKLICLSPHEPAEYASDFKQETQAHNLRHRFDDGIASLSKVALNVGLNAISARFRSN